MLGSGSKSPITTQPLLQNAISAQHNYRPPNCAPGLEYLLQINQLLVQQRVELFETLFHCETNNQYVVKNIMGQQIYLAQEDSGLFALLCCGPNRPFLIKILDNTKREVMHISRPLRCTACCFPCCLQCMKVEAPPGNTIGFVEQDFSCCYPKFSVKNSLGDRVLRIEGPLCTFSILFNDVVFPVYSTQGYKVEVARITKQWSGLLREAFTDADNFGVVFPIDLDVNIKACILAAVFLIDFMFFEKKANVERDRPGMMD